MAGRRGCLMMCWMGIAVSICRQSAVQTSSICCPDSFYKTEGLQSTRPMIKHLSSTFMHIYFNRYIFQPCNNPTYIQQMLNHGHHSIPNQWNVISFWKWSKIEWVRKWVRFFSHSFIPQVCQWFVGPERIDEHLAGNLSSIWRSWI